MVNCGRFQLRNSLSQETVCCSYPAADIQRPTQKTCAPLYLFSGEEIHLTAPCGRALSF